MKWKLSPSAATKLAIILGLILVAPYVAPFAIDFVILADLAGLEALILIVFAFSKATFLTLRMRVQQMGQDIAAVLWLLARLPVFQTRVYLGHATLSGALLVFCCSVALACLVWLPVLVLSAQTIA